MPQEPIAFHQDETRQESEFELDRIIDKYNLDVEWEDQQRRYKKWSDAYVEASALSEKADEYVKYLESQLDNDIRENWSAINPDKKMTEAGVKAAIKSNDEYRQAVYAYIDARRIAGHLANAMRSFDHRKTALERLTELDGRNYFSRPSINKNVRSTVSENVAQERLARTREELAQNPRLEQRRTRKRLVV